LAREADPDGKRCLGVLTKPDKIEGGTESTVIDMLRGDIYGLQWGYFIVRCPRQDELKRLKGMDSLTEAEKEVSSCCGTETPERTENSSLASESPCLYKHPSNICSYPNVLTSRSGAALRMTTSVLISWT